MSDTQYGEPVDENVPTDEATSADAAVASAQAGLAEAEAVSRDIAAAPEAEEQAAAVAPEADIAAPAPVAETPAEVATAGSLYANDPIDEEYVPGAYSDSAPTEVVAETLAPTVVAPAVVAPVVADATPQPQPQPIFVQAPEAPRPRGNRAAAGAIGVLAALAFGILYLAAALGLRAIDGTVTTTNVGTETVAALASWWFWVPVVVFFLAFWLLGAIINRGRWGHWVIFGLLVGAAAYGGHLLGQLFQAPFWQLTASQGEELVSDQLLAPLAIVAFVLGRELTVWFGAWIAARGKRVSELNREAQREYERTLEAGPRIHQG